ncbi:MvdC/MvdD family ATP grasp protein [Vibrio penaeicida]|uniref:MvdD-like pre-ATP grasp domain-containing protein n=1 Tax=Vibrio penaeicida TaxID=104609 RepID=A0AAV5NZX2_9VIBR|nr:hypothetical protein [Vibrio penaeicida]GLQ76044.1 hypothetical protein GCM10007932_54070 [Vibrio penaeicida]
MTKNKVLIITHSKDNQSIDTVSELLKQAGVVPVRFNTDLFPTKVQIATHQNNNGNESTLITENGDVVKGDEILAVWYRRFYPAKGLPADMDIQLKQPSAEESKRTILGYLDSLECYKLDDYWDIRHASNKEYQLMLARKVGLNLPNTLTSNSPEAVRDFFADNNGKIITKMQTAFSVWNDDVEQVVFTNKVEEEHLEKLEELNLCPMVFQEHVIKDVELRATVVGNQVYCASIDPDIMKGMETDWRKRGVYTLDKWQPFELPQEEADKLIRLATELKLNYGAADLILTPDGQYKFLEINPCGEFYWMDIYQKLGICEAIAQNLVAGGR